MLFERRKGKGFFLSFSIPEITLSLSRSVKMTDEGRSGLVRPENEAILVWLFVLGGRGICAAAIGAGAGCRGDSAVLGRRRSFGSCWYCELGVDVSVGSGDFSRGDRGSNWRGSVWLLLIRRKSICVLWLSLRAGEADVRVLRLPRLSGESEPLRSSGNGAVRLIDSPEFEDRGLGKFSEPDLDPLDTILPILPRKFGLVSARFKSGFRGLTNVSELDCRLLGTCRIVCGVGASLSS